jgi:signal transduction histidine kinase
MAAEIRRQAAYLDGAARSRGLELCFDMPAENWVHADVALAGRLVANLLGNAVAHTPAGSAIQVRLAANGSFTIDNPAPQLCEADLPRLGERFFRIPSGNGGTHAGLGLSLATAAAKILGLTLQLSLTPDRHLRAAVSGFKPLPG